LRILATLAICVGLTRPSTVLSRLPVHGMPDSVQYFPDLASYPLQLIHLCLFCDDRTSPSTSWFMLMISLW
jgi:hypothetical protein